jgi:hypothetical protein
MHRWSRFALALAPLAVVVLMLSTAGTDRTRVSFVLDLGFLQIVLQT